MKALPYEVHWRADGEEWRVVASFAAQGDAWAYTLDLAGRPVTGAVKLVHKGRAIYEPDCYVEQKRKRAKEVNDADQ